MAASVSLSTSVFSVEPGSEGAIELHILNTGPVVDQFTVTVLGDSEAWAVVEPEALSLFPNDSGTITIRFRPPRDSTVSAGPIPFGLRVYSTEDPESSTVEEGTVHVSPFLLPTAELLPRTARGSRRASYELAIDNRGNVGMNADLSGFDQNGDLRFRFDPPSAVVPPGTAAFVKTTVTAVQPFWKGMPKTRPFKIRVDAPNQSVPTTQLDGVMLHEARLPRWFFKAVALVAAAAVVLVALWFAVLKPTIHNEARTAAQAATQQQTAPLAAEVAGAQKTADAANQNATAADQKVGVPVAPVAPTSGPLTTPTGARLTLNVAPNASPGSTNLPGIPQTQPFNLTDVVFENANGDAGTVSITLGQGGKPVLQENLANFRSLDYHFVSPIVFPAGTAVTFQATCTTPGTGQTSCMPAVYIGGFTGTG